MKETAISICDQYLMESANSKIIIEERLLKNLTQRINTETISDDWFDDILNYIYCKLQVIKNQLLNCVNY